LRPAIEAALETGEVDQAIAGICNCCKDVVGRAKELKANADAAVEDLVRELEGFYECRLYDNEGKNDWHFVELRRSLASGKMPAALTWSNRAGVTWTLTPSFDADGIAKLLVGAECPYFDDGHQVCELDLDDSGHVVGVLGPQQELYSRSSFESGLVEVASTDVLSDGGDASCMVEVATLSADTFSDASSELCPTDQAPSQAPMAAVLFSKLDVGRDQWLFEDAELRGDVTKEFSDFIKSYQNVTQAYRLGCVAFSLSQGGDGTTVDVVSKIVVQNTGAVAWSDFSSLRSVAGPSHGLPEMMLGAVPAGDKVEIVLDLKILEGEGGRSAWVMCDQRGEPFGPVLLFEVVHM